MLKQRKEKLLAKHASLVEEFKRDVCSRAVDINSECPGVEWSDLAVGWLMGKGVSLDDASVLSIALQYDFRFWQED